MADDGAEQQRIEGMQRLLYAARWDADAVRDELSCFVAESFGDAEGIFVMDETGFLVSVASD
jgi:hypothetical protein